MQISNLIYFYHLNVLVAASMCKIWQTLVVILEKDFLDISEQGLLLCCFSPVHCSAMPFLVGWVKFGWGHPDQRGQDSPAGVIIRWKPILVLRCTLPKISFGLFPACLSFCLSCVLSWIFRIYNKLRCICDCLSSMGKWIC